MKRFLGLALALCLALTLSLTSLAENGEKTITVIGTHTIMLPADSATIQLGAYTRATSAALAQSDSEKIITAMLAALQELGIDKADIVTSSYYVNAEVPYTEPGSIRAPEVSYTVTNMLLVKVRDLSLLSQVIDVSTKAGANQIYSLVFDSSKAGEAFHEALAQAVADGKAKATTLSAAAGTTLGELKSLTTNEFYGSPYDMGGYMDMSASAKANTILSGNVNVTASVTMAFGFN